MSPRPLSLDQAVWVSPQIDIAELEDLARSGFGTILSHRPDDEEPGQPSAEHIAAKADEAGLRFVHAPFQGYPDHAVVEATAQALADLAPDQRLLMFCRSGMRSTVAWALAMRALGRAEPDEIREAAARAGYDLSRLPL